MSLTIFDKCGIIKIIISALEGGVAMNSCVSSLVSFEDKIGIASINGVPISIKGGQNVEEAVREMSKYGLITFSREQTFKSTNYAIHFFKPVEKLKQLYNLGDEVLILCGNDNFSEFKSRTKDFLDYLLTSSSEYRNRLDKVTCFLFDNYDNICDLVKQDRVDNPDARLVVPFSYGEAHGGISEDLLQGRLRSFLYERDLFGIASPLQNDNLFFGKDRTNIISELYGKYRQGEHGGLFGLRRIGKTSILNLLRRRVEQAGGVAVYFDCTKYHHLRWNSFLHQIVREIQDKYSYDSNDVDSLRLPKSFSMDEAAVRYAEPKAPISFEKDIKQLYTALSSQRILLIFDEIEQISSSTSPSEHWKNGNDSLFFWQSLRAIAQTDSSLISFVVTGVNPKCVEDSKINGNDNPIFNVLTPQYISLFDFADVKTMVSDIGRHLGLHFDEEIYTKLVDDYGGHPFLTRQVCSKINSDALNAGTVRPFTVSKYTYNRKSEDYLVQMEAVITQILGVLQDYYPNEYELLKVLALNGSDYFKKKLKYGDSSIVHLLGYRLIHKVDGEYYIRIRTIESYLKNKHKYDKVVTDVSEKRAQITVRRGQIEDSLRQLIYSQMKLKFGKKAKEQMISKLAGSTTDKSQEKKIQALDFAEAMKELYFSQLKHLMLKDWNSYQPIFNDRVKFEQFFDIINSCRIDAHAKNLDEEDEAILNIAFKFFENSLSDS